MNTLKFLYIFKPKMSKFVDDILVMKLFISIINYFFFSKRNLSTNARVLLQPRNMFLSRLNQVLVKIVDNTKEH